MKKTFILLVLFLSAVFIGNAQTTITISGNVTDSSTLNAIDKHEVIITSDSIGGTSWHYYDVVYTDSKGDYSSTVTIPAGISTCNFNVMTFDCNRQLHVKVLSYPSGSYIADFAICNSIGNYCQSYFGVTPDSQNTLKFQFNDYSIGNPSVWLWTFGDNTSSTLKNPVHTYAQAGTYTVTLTISDSTSSCTDVSTQTISTNSKSCRSYFTYTIDQTVSGKVNFIADTISTTATYIWNFGDSSTAIGQNVSHTYNTLLSYYVCLTVIDSVNNCYDVYCELVRLGHGGCVSSFSYYDSNLTVAFVSTNIFSGASYTWDYGDGTTYTDTSYATTHTYAKSGVYNVCLTVSGTGINCIKYCANVSIGLSNNRASLSGFVYTGNSFADYAKVYLITFNPVDTTLSAIDSSYVDSSGIYFFINISYGSYLLKAALEPASAVYSNYLPTYYNTVLFWYQAQNVSVNQVNPAVMVDIHMLYGTNPGGQGFIGGKVTKGANFRSGYMKNIQIVLLNEKNEAVAYTYSDANGEFAFENLSYGTYKVYTEIMNKTCYPAVVSISADNDKVDDIEFTVNRYIVVTSVKEIGFEFFTEVGLPYPNPAKNKVSVNIKAKNPQQIQMSLYNSLGEILKISDYHLTNGLNQLVIDVNTFNKGIYFIKLEDGNGQSVTKSFKK